MLFLSIILLILLLIRLVYVFNGIGRKKQYGCQKKLKLMAIAGSGGHTTELVRLLESLPSNFAVRHYVIATSDQISEKKLLESEKRRKNSSNCKIFWIPRSREVAQSWLTTIYTTFVASLHAFPILWKGKPDVLLCNGPGTCIPLCAVSLLFKGHAAIPSLFDGHALTITRFAACALSELCQYLWN